MVIDIKEKKIVNSKVVLKLKDQSKVIDKHVGIYSDLKGRPFSEYKTHINPATNTDVVMMRSNDNVVHLNMSDQNTTLIYNYHPTYQMNVKGSMEVFTSTAELVYHSIIDIVKDLSDIEVMGCINLIHIPTLSLNPSQLLFEQFVKIPGIDNVNTLNLGFSVIEEESFFINYGFNKYEQKTLSKKPENPQRPTKEELEASVKTGEGIQLTIDINNRPLIRSNGDFGKEQVSELMEFSKETVINCDSLFK